MIVGMNTSIRFNNWRWLSNTDKQAGNELDHAQLTLCPPMGDLWDPHSLAEMTIAAKCMYGLIWNFLTFPKYKKPKI